MLGSRSRRFHGRAKRPALWVLLARETVRFYVLLARGTARFGLPGLLLLVALACGSCTTTPTLPLPPPVASAGVPDADGFAQIEGQVHALAYVSVLNEASEEGVITRANNDGYFKTRIAAVSGDLLTIWQDLGDGVASEQKHLSVPGLR